MMYPLPENPTMREIILHFASPMYARWMIESMTKEELDSPPKPLPLDMKRYLKGSKAWLSGDMPKVAKKPHNVIFDID